MKEVIDFTNIEHKKLSGFWRRFAAFSFDYFIINIICSIGLGIIIACGYVFINLFTSKIDMLSSQNYLTSSDGYDMIFGLILVFAYLLYTFSIFGLTIYIRVVQQSKYAQSWGKKFFGLYILHDSNRRMTIGEALGRAFLYILEVATLGIGWIIMLFRSDKKTLSDIIVETSVYKLEDKKYKTRVIIWNIGYFVIYTIMIWVYMYMLFTSIQADRVRTKMLTDKTRSDMITYNSPIDLNSPDGCYGVDGKYEGEDNVALFEFKINSQEKNLSYMERGTVMKVVGFDPTTFNYSEFMSDAKDYGSMVYTQMVNDYIKEKNESLSNKDKIEEVEKLDLKSIDVNSIDGRYCEPLPITGGNS